MMIDLIINTPPNIWIFLAILLSMGYKATFPRTRSIFRLLIIPIIFLYMESRTTMTLFNIDLITIMYNFVGLLFGVIIGIIITLNRKIIADKEKYLIQLPGENTTLLLIIINFLFQYLIHVLAYFKLPIFYEYSSLALIAMGIFSGISSGKAFTYLYKFKKLYITQ
jgi:uncharacterized membrane protein YesL